MALLFIDSADHYATADILDKWSAGNGLGTTTNIHATEGRRSSPCLKSTVTAANSTSPFVVKTLAPADTTMMTGFACKPQVVAADYPLFTIGDNANWHCGVYGTGTGALNVRRGPTFGGTVLGTTSAVLATGVFTFVEILFTIHDTAGVVTIRFNGVSVLALTSQDTKDSTLVGWTRVAWHTLNAAGGTLHLDDVYVLDGSGAAPWNAFLGDCRVDARYPTAAGATTGWTPSTGANWSCVDEAAPNDDTDYTTATTTGLTDTFVVQDAPVAGNVIYGVQSCLNLKATAAGTCTLASVMRHSGTDYPGAAITAGTSYAYGLQIAQTNPGTGAAWTEAGFNAAEFGYRRTS